MPRCIPTVDLERVAELLSEGHGCQVDEAWLVDVINELLRCRKKLAAIKQSAPQKDSL